MEILDMTIIQLILFTVFNFVNLWFVSNHLYFESKTYTSFFVVYGLLILPVWIDVPFYLVTTLLLAILL